MVVAICGAQLLLGEPSAEDAAYWKLQPSPPVVFILLSPVIESVLVAATASALLALFGTTGKAAVASGILWGGIHAIVAPIRFFGSAWAFVILSIAYLAWRPKSFAHGLLAAFLPHALGNATTLLVATALGGAPQ